MGREGRVLRYWDYCETTGMELFWERAGGVYNLKKRRKSGTVIQMSFYSFLLLFLLLLLLPPFSSWSVRAFFFFKFNVVWDMPTPLLPWRLFWVFLFLRKILLLKPTPSRLMKIGERTCGNWVAASWWVGFSSLTHLPIVNFEYQFLAYLRSFG